jgi:hypothetical protein
MTGAIPSEQAATFTTIYDRLARAWADHEDLRLAGAEISDLYQSSLHLSKARDEMWAWWRKNRLQGVR